MGLTGHPIARALSKVLVTLLDPDKFRIVLAERENRDDLWEGAVRDGKKLVLIADGDTTSDEDICGASMWLVARAITEKNSGSVICVAVDMNPPERIRSCAELIQRAVSPHVLVGPWLGENGLAFDLSALLTRLERPPSSNLGAQADMKRALIDEFCAPEHRHSISNHVAPSLLRASLRQLTAAGTDETGGRDPWERLLEGLGLLDLREPDSEGKMAAAESVNASRARWKHATKDMPVTVVLVDDNMAFKPFLDLFLGTTCLQFTDAADPKIEAIASNNKVNSIFFVDMRLAADDAKKTRITETSGFELARKLAKNDPERSDIPVILFSSTQQRRLFDAVRQEQKQGRFNLISFFSKPSLAAGGMIDQNDVANSLRGLAEACNVAVRLLEHRRLLCCLDANGVAGDVLKGLRDKLNKARWSEILLMEMSEPRPKSFAQCSRESDIELLRQSSEKVFLSPHFTDLLDTNPCSAGVADEYLWALAMCRLWLRTGDETGLREFIGRLQNGLLSGWQNVTMEGIPLAHQEGENDTLHDVILWAVTVEKDIRSSVRTLLLHCKGGV